MKLTDYPNELPAITLDFQNSRQLDPRINFSRASAASPDSSSMVNGKVQQFAANVPRLGDNGLLIEESRANYLGKYASPNYNSGSATYAAYSDSTFGAAQNAHSWTWSSSASNGQIGWSDPNNISTTGDDVKYTISAWVKANQTYKMQGDIADERRLGINFTWNLTTEWQYFTATTGGGTDDGLGTVYFRWIKKNGAVPAGLKIDIAAFTLERSGYPTSFIPLDAGSPSTVITRAADVVEMPAAYNVNQNTIINNDFGIAGGSDTLTIVGDGTKAKRTAVYNSWLTQEQTAALTGTDDWWEWRVLGSSFGLPNFTTDGQVSVDWGDGTVETLTTSDHTFTNGGGYHTIKFKLDSGNWFQPTIQNNATHKLKLISVGPMPVGMSCNFNNFARGCSNLVTFDAAGCSADYSPGFSMAFRSCSSLLSFPYIDTSDATGFYYTWDSCSTLTRLPLLDSSNVTDFRSTLMNCSKLKDFPAFDTSKATSITRIAQSCTVIATFPWVDTSGCTGAATDNWNSCTKITSFPLLDFKNTSYNECWKACSSLTDFPANAFDSTPITEGKGHGKSWAGAWQGCPLTVQSIENILVSLDNNGAENCEVFVSGASKTTWTTAANDAYDNLIAKGWTVNHNA